MCTVLVLTVIFLLSFPFVTELEYMKGVIITPHKKVFVGYKYVLYRTENKKSFHYIEFDSFVCNDNFRGQSTGPSTSEQDTFNLCVGKSIKSLEKSVWTKQKPLVKFVSFGDKNDSEQWPSNWSLDTIRGALETLAIENSIEFTVQHMSQRIIEFLHYISFLRDAHLAKEVPFDPMIKIDNHKLTFITPITHDMEDPPALVKFLVQSENIKFFSESYYCNGLNNLRYLTRLHLAIREHHKNKNSENSRDIILNDPCLAHPILETKFEVIPEDNCYNIKKYPFLTANKYRIRPQFSLKLCLDLITESLTDANVCYNKQQCLQLTKNHYLYLPLSEFTTFQIVYKLIVINFDVVADNVMLNSIESHCLSEPQDFHNELEWSDLCFLHMYVFTVVTHWRHVYDTPPTLKYSNYRISKLTAIAYLDERLEYIEEISSDTKKDETLDIEPSKSSDTTSFEGSTSSASETSTPDDVAENVSSQKRSPKLATSNMDVPREYPLIRMKYQVPLSIERSIKKKETILRISTIVLGIIAIIFSILMIFSICYRVKKRLGSPTSKINAHL